MTLNYLADESARAENHLYSSDGSPIIVSTRTNVKTLNYRVCATASQSKQSLSVCNLGFKKEITVSLSTGNDAKLQWCNLSLSAHLFIR